MKMTDFEHLHAYAASFVGLDDKKIQTLHRMEERVSPHLEWVTEEFYSHLLSIPKAAPFLEGRLDSLKPTHMAWIRELFNSPYDVAYTEKMYRVGDVHVKVQLPVEFMAGAMSLLEGILIQVILRVHDEQPEEIPAALQAINTALGFSLLIMQESYQASSLAQELEKFLSITGMSRKLFDNLARAYR